MDIHIPNDTSMNEAIDNSQPGDTLLFDAGHYVFAKTLYIQNDRRYWIDNQRISVSDDFQGDWLIEIHNPIAYCYIANCVIDNKGKGVINFIGGGFLGLIDNNISH